MKLSETKKENLLELYEFSKAIGNSLDYVENCNELLPAMVQNKNLSGAFILSLKDSECRISYTYTKNQIISDFAPEIEIINQLQNQKDELLNIDSDQLNRISPIQSEGDCGLIFELKKEGYLVFQGVRAETIPLNDIHEWKKLFLKFDLILHASRLCAEKDKSIKDIAEQSKELNDFTNVLAHDLRTPLRNIETLASWLLEDYGNLLDGVGLKRTSQIRENLQKMEDLIEGIQIYSGLNKESNKRYLVDVNEIIDKSLKILNFKKKVNLNIPEAMPSIYGDRHRLFYLFKSLLDNAIKFCDKEECIIEINSNKTEDGYYFQIRDNGIGINESYHTKVFELFQKLDSREKSLGVGLSLVKKIVSYFNGEIWIESNFHEGCTFHFTLKELR